jgi:hypothetical protein
MRQSRKIFVEKVRLTALSAVGTKHPGFEIHQLLSIVSNVNTSYSFMGRMPTY